jgi:hypothetical protein
LGVVDPAAHIPSRHPILVEIDVQEACASEQTAQVGPSQLVGNLFGDVEK